MALLMLLDGALLVYLRNSLTALKVLANPVLLTAHHVQT
jgi:hypothetical protein